MGSASTFVSNCTCGRGGAGRGGVGRLSTPLCVEKYEYYVNYIGVYVLV